MARFPRFRSSPALLVLVALLAIVTAGCSARRETPPAVVLVSVDGFRWDYPSLYPTPTFDRIAREGARAERMVPSFPSKTFPNHYTLVTGLVPGHHGVVGNEMWDDALGRFDMGRRDAVQDARWWGGEPVWVTAERRGLATAPYFWPGSEAPIGGLRPSRWHPYEHEMPNEARIERVLEALTGADGPPAAFATLYLSDVDSAGHLFDPRSLAVGVAVARVDGALARLLGELAHRRLRRVDVVVVSDHGMAPASAERVIVLADHLDLDRVRVVSTNPVLTLVPEPGVATDDVLTALRGVGPQLAVFARDETPERWAFRGNPRVPPVVAVAAEGWTIVTQRRLGVGGGEHGYDPATARTMDGIFYAIGPSIRRGARVGAIDNVDVYPLLCRLLDLPPRPHDGDPAALAPLLR